jgi:hypothetical protein
LDIDTVVQFHSIQVLNNEEQEEIAIAAYWITDAIDHCCVGFLPHYYIKYQEELERKVAQNVEFASRSRNMADRRRS